MRRRPKHLADREESDRTQDDVDAADQLGPPEGQARLARLQVDSDETEQQPQARRESGLGRNVAGERSDRRHGEDHERKVFRGTEPQRDADQRGRGEGEEHGGDRARHERAHGGGGQRGTGAAALRHLESVERGHRGRRVAGRIHEDGGGRAAVHRAVVDAAEKNEGRRGVETERDREQQRDRCRGAEAGEDADRRPEHDAEQAEEQVRRSERGGEP
jgi:hypothetical protein